MPDDRRIELSLTAGELRDLAKAVDHRLSALNDQLPGWRSTVVARLTDLQARIDTALKALAKMPGGSDA